MKQLILFLFSFLMSSLLSAQVGINTNNPLAVFHIDGDGLNSATPTATEQLNDVVITKDGNIGIGIINPTNKLSINTTGNNTGLHLPNGASVGKVLTSDSNGNAKWEMAGFSDFAQLPGFESPKIPLTSSPFYYTGYQFQLGIKGTYQISFSMIVNVLAEAVGSFEGIHRSAIILRSTNIPTDYVNNSIRFLGSYEQPAIVLDATHSVRQGIGLLFNLNQTITTVLDNQMVYVLLWIGDAPSYVNRNTKLTVIAGERGSQTTGGSSVRIN
jgi:hypothetical protein